MPQCVSNKADGQRCSKMGNPDYDGMCDVHHRQKLRQDLGYATRFAEVPEAPPAPPVFVRQAAVHEPRVHVIRLFGIGQQRLPPSPLSRYNRLRQSIIVIRDDMNRIMDLGRPAFNNNAMFDQLQQKMNELTVIFERIQPLRTEFNEPVENEINAELDTIRAIVQQADAIAQPIFRRRREEAMRDVLAHNFLHLADVVQHVQRDPEGGIDLRAFAVDAQSVHRSSVQTMAQQGIEKILAKPAPVRDEDTLFEITVAFTSPSIRWVDDNYALTIQELHRDYEYNGAFGVKYSRVVDHLWSFIKTHVERIELTRRFAEELLEGRGMCANGKMSRLTNVLQGYDEDMAVVVAPQREQFQSKMSALSMRPYAERRDAAMALFAEYNIPVVEHDAWLEPLLDA